jgi:LacI family transcriptional regulator
MAVNMKDIARELGVSVVTVSKALRNHPDISDATRERIRLKVKELGYRPNLTARSLVTGRSSLIGLIVPDLIHPFFAEVAKGLSSAARKQGYCLVISSSEEDRELESQEIEHMLAHRLDAMVLASCQADAEFLTKIPLAGTPLILIDRSFKEFPSHFVGSDDYVAGKLAAEHLLECGCQRIAHVRGPDNSVGKRRLKGFADTLKNLGVALPSEFIVSVPHADVAGGSGGGAALRSLMALPHMPDGIFCYNDVIAVGLINEAMKQGIRVPQQVKVLGCGNVHYGVEIGVPLTSIDQRSTELGVRTAELILDLLGGEKPTEHRSIVLQPRLIPRASTGREAT